MPGRALGEVLGGAVGGTEVLVATGLALIRPVLDEPGSAEVSVQAPPGDRDAG